MITKKALKHNARFWENECDKYARLYYQSLVEIERLKKEISTNQDFFRDLLRYGKIKSDFEVKENTGRLFRVRVFEYEGKKYFTVMCDGEPLRCEEV